MVVVKAGQRMIMFLSSGIVILFAGSHSKMRLSMQSSSSVRGKIDLRNFEFRKKAVKVASSMEAFFHGLRPQVRLIKITPRDHTSLGADA